jgi:3-oxoacyl-[acyl-carrier-protein] synthase II
VAPRSPNVEAFAANLERAGSWLTPFGGFGPDNFLVGRPDFHFADYREWIATRFPPNRFRQLEEKMDLPTLYAIGAFIQALGQNPGLEEELTRLGTRAHVYVGTGIGSVASIAEGARALDRAQRRWDRFWAEKNPDLAAHLAASPEERAARRPDAPALPDDVPPEERPEAEEIWWHYWAGCSPDLAAYLDELRQIEAIGVDGDIESGKISMLKEKQRRYGQLQKRWAAPEPPWRSVSANLIWNIHNTPAAQISMLGRITGLAFAPVAACSTFGVALKLAMDSIDRGEADAVVVGATDPPPHPLIVGAFYNARVIAADAGVSKPLTALRGTHVAGGSVVWIVGDLERMTARGFRPLGMEPVAVGVSADADHIITPSKDGPTEAMRQALAMAGVAPCACAAGAEGQDAIGSWDLHATATPGDYLELLTLRQVVPGSVLVTARKGTFGHGMGAGGGWELTAQYLGYERGRLYPTPLTPGEVNREIAALHDVFVFDRAEPVPPGLAGKLSMGIGGINACVVSRPWS